MATTSVLAFVIQPGEAVPSVGEPTVRPKEPRGDRQTANSAPLEDVRQRATPVAARLAEARGINLNVVAGTGLQGRVTRKDIEFSDPDVGGRVNATPAARRLSKENEVTLLELSGSGPEGRIQAIDVMAASGAPKGVSQTERIELEGMRATIAERMAYSARTAPHFTLEIDVDVTRMEVLRKELNQMSDIGISATAVVIRAVAWSLNWHPMAQRQIGREHDLVEPRDQYRSSGRFARWTRCAGNPRRPSQRRKADCD